MDPEKIAEHIIEAGCTLKREKNWTILEGTADLDEDILVDYIKNKDEVKKILIEKGL